MAGAAGRLASPAASFPPNPTAEPAPGVLCPFRNTNTPAPTPNSTPNHPNTINQFNRPVLTKVKYELLHELLAHPSILRHFAVSFALNWIIGPALMTALAWACLPDLPAFRSGVIMVGLARCIAMVLIWNQLALGDAEMCAVMVAFNSILQIVLYAPLSIFYLQVGLIGLDWTGFDLRGAPLVSADL